MLKNVFGRHLSRTANQRKALFRNLVCSLVEKGEIETTLAKAKAIKGETEKLITKAKKGNLVNRRFIFRFLRERVFVNKLMDEIAPRLKERKSGYLRIVRVGTRRGDNAPLAKMMFVDDIFSSSGKESEEKRVSREKNKTSKTVAREIKKESENDKADKKD